MAASRCAVSNTPALCLYICNEFMNCKIDDAGDHVTVNVYSRKKMCAGASGSKSERPARA